jgi:acetyl esterase/lipase
LETLYHTCPDVNSQFNQVKLPRPGSLLMVSPYTGDEELGSAVTNLSSDYISEETRDKMSEYLPHNKDIEAFSYRVKTVSYAQFLPHHIVVFVGGKEVLLDVGLVFAKRCREENLRVSVIREELPHDWAMLGRLFTSDHNVVKRAVITVVDLAQEMLNSNQAST